MNKYLITLFLFLNSFLCADLPRVDDPFQTGPVHPRTGTFSTGQCDLVVDGIEPIIISRSYSSAVPHEGWEFFPHLKLELIPSFVKGNKGKHHHRAWVNVYGCTLPLSMTQKKKGYKKYLLDLAKDGAGIHNLALREISARTNLKNTILEGGKQTLTLTLPDKTKRIYEYAITDDHFNRIYHLKKETLPSGRHIVYSYDKHGRIEKIQTKSPSEKVCYAWAEFKYKGKPEKSHDYTIKTSSDQTADYQFDKQRDGSYLLQQVDSSDLPTETLTYYKPVSKGPRYLTRRTLPEGREMSICYYHAFEKRDIPGKNDVYIDSFYDRLCMRVHCLQESVGQSGQLCRTHTYEYDPNGKDLTTVHGADGSSVQFSYDNYLPAAITIEESKQTFTWSKTGEFKSKTLKSEGKTLEEVTIKYDTCGNAIKLTQDGAVTTYSYDKEDLLIKEELPNGAIIETRYLTGTDLPTARYFGDGEHIYRREFYFYDNERTVVQEMLDNGSSYDHQNLSDVTHRFCRVIKPKQSGHGVHKPERIEEKSYDLETECWVDLQTTHLEYDARGNITQKTICDADGKQISVEKATYNNQSLPILEIDSLGRETRTSYDIFGNKTCVVDPSGKKKTFHYDKANRCINETIDLEDGPYTAVHTYNNKPQKTSTTDPFGQTTYFTYDQKGNCISTTGPDGTQTNTLYDALNRPIAIADQNGHIQTISYDVKKKEIHYPDATSEIFLHNPDGSLHTHLDGACHLTAYTHDILGHLTSKTREGKTATWAYDGLHLLEKTDFDGKKTTYTYDIYGRRESKTSGEKKATYRYDSLGNLLHKIENETLITTTERNSLGQLLEKTQTDLEGNCHFKESYAYDGADHLTQITKYHNNAPCTYTRTYDPLGRILQEKDPLGHTTAYNYSSKKRQMTTLDPMGRKTKHDFDCHGRLIRMRSLQTDTHYSYDPRGNLLEETHKAGKSFTITRAYDSMGRCIQQTEQNDRTTNYTYTPLGQIKSFTKPDQTTLHYTYDPFGNLQTLNSSDGAIDYTYHYTPRGRLISCTNNNTQLSTTRTLNDQGQITSEILENGHIFHYTYDNLKRPIAYTLPDQTTIHYSWGPLYLNAIDYQDHRHEYLNYDLAGTLLTETNATYTIDPLGRPISLETPHFQQTQDQFDPAGNLLAMTHSGQPHAFTYDDQNQLLTTNGHTYNWDPLGNRTQTDGKTHTLSPHHELLDCCTYDANGNPITKNGLLFTYDPLDRLTTVTKPGDFTVHYTYDGLHRRTSKTDQEKTISYYYLQDEEIGTVDQLKITLPGSQKPVLLLLDQKPYHPTIDLQNNLAILSQDGIPFEEHHFGPFGENATPSKSPWSYRCKRHDPETGLILFNRRYYDPETGRFLTPDPLGFTGSPNLYTFARNNPLINTDPTGLLNLTLWGDPELTTPDHFKDPTTTMNESAGFIHGSVLTATSHLISFGAYAGMSSWQEEEIYKAMEAWLQKAIPTDVKSPAYRNQRQAVEMVGAFLPIAFSGASSMGLATARYAMPLLKGLTFETRVFRSAKTALSRRNFSLLNPTKNTTLVKTALAKSKSLPTSNLIEAVIAETIGKKGRFTSRYVLSADQALEAGMKFLGPGYKQIGKPMQGVFRSKDGLRQFRIDNTSLLGQHKPKKPHVHLEMFNKFEKDPHTINHIVFWE